MTNENIQKTPSNEECNVIKVIFVDRKEIDERIASAHKTPSLTIIPDDNHLYRVSIGTNKYIVAKDENEAYEKLMAEIKEFGLREFLEDSADIKEIEEAEELKNGFKQTRSDHYGKR